MRRDVIIAGLLFFIAAASALLASPRQGIHRDEAYYMDAGEEYVTYWSDVLSGKADTPFSDETIKRYWSYNHEHPPLFKLLYGISWRLFHKCDCAKDKAWHPGIARLENGRHVTLGLLSETEAFRLPTILAYGALVALVYLFFRSFLGSRLGALAAALLMAMQPRAFFHAQTASFDLPAAMLWFATTFAYARALKRPSWILPGLLYGLFLATKLQSFFLPIALGIHWIGLGLTRKRRGESWPTPAPLLSMLVIAPLVFFGLWPWLWHDTWARLGEYLAFHLSHVHYNFEYLGTNYNRPPYPWHEPLGMLVTTAPVILLVLAALGLMRLPKTHGVRSLLALVALVPVLPFLLGIAPIFGETKHWLATMPYLALLAGIAVDRLAEGIMSELHWEARPLLRRAVNFALVVVACAPALAETVHSHPYGLSHYNALAGGPSGGADLGMNRQFWGYSVSGLLPWLNEHLPKDARLYLHDLNHDAFELYLRAGRLRPDIGDAGMEDSGVRSSTAALVIHEKHFAKYDFMIWKAFGHVQPAEVLTFDGVPLATVYTRKP